MVAAHGDRSDTWSSRVCVPPPIQETLWENPAEAKFKELYKKQRIAGEASGVAIFQLASRAAARQREVDLQKGVERDADLPAAGHRRNSLAGPAVAVGSPTNTKIAPVAASGRRNSTKWSAPDGAMGPTQFMELAEYLGIKVNCEPQERECHLLNFVGDYLDKAASNALPAGWVTYKCVPWLGTVCAAAHQVLLASPPHSDDNGAPYYFNESTGESTYDYPVIIELHHKIKARRRIMAEDPELGPQYRGTEIHRYWAFSTGKRVYYYNVKTGDRLSTPPDIGQRATTLVQKRVRGFLARLRAKLAGKRRVAESGGMYTASASQWDILTASKVEEDAETEAANEMLRSETDKWEREKNQREVKEKLEAVLAKYGSARRARRWLSALVSHLTRCALLLAAGTRRALSSVEMAGGPCPSFLRCSTC